MSRASLTSVRLLEWDKKGAGVSNVAQSGSTAAENGEGLEPVRTSRLIWGALGYKELSRLSFIHGGRSRGPCAIANTRRDNAEA